VTRQEFSLLSSEEYRSRRVIWYLCRPKMVDRVIWCCCSRRALISRVRRYGFGFEKQHMGGTMLKAWICQTRLAQESPSHGYGVVAAVLAVLRSENPHSHGLSQHRRLSVPPERPVRLRPSSSTAQYSTGEINKNQHQNAMGWEWSLMRQARRWSC
jgi:hypothetical protein